MGIALEELSFEWAILGNAETVRVLRTSYFF